MHLEQNNCCGFMEIADIRSYSDPKECLYQIFRYRVYEMDHWGGAYMWFTDHIDMKAGHKLAQCILDEKLGDLYEIPIRHNTNSGNKVRAWMWAFNAETCLKWFKAKEKEKANAEEANKKAETKYPFTAAWGRDNREAEVAANLRRLRAGLPPLARRR